MFKVFFYFNILWNDLAISIVERTDYFVEWTDHTLEWSDLERSDHGTKSPDTHNRHRCGFSELQKRK